MAKAGDFGRLRVVSGPDAGAEFVVADGSVCGRALGCGMRLNDNGVSKQHFAISVEHGRVEIKDSGSSNGTRVNARQVTGAVLSPGDEIEVGGTVLRYERSGFRRPLPKGVIVALLVVLVAGGGAYWLWQSGMTRRQKKLDTHLHWAEEFEKQHAYSDALYEYRILGEIAPRAGYQCKIDEMTRLVTRDGLIARISFVAESDEYEKAAAMLDSLLPAYPDDPEIQRLAADVKQGREHFMLVSQVRALRDQKLYDQALAALDSAGPASGGPQAGSEAAAVLLRKGYDLQNRGLTNAARQAFEAARQRDGANAEVGRALDDLNAATRYSAYVLSEVPDRTSGTRIRGRTGRSVPPAKIPSEPAGMVVGDTVLAGLLLEQAHVALTDNNDTSEAVAKYEEACRTTGARTSVHQRAAARLEKLGRRVPSPLGPASIPVVNAGQVTEAATGAGTRTMSGPSAQAHASAPAGEDGSSRTPADIGTISEPEQRRRQAKAKELYWEGFGLLNDLNDTVRSVEKFRQVRETLPDPSYEFHRKATEWLRKLRKL